MLGLDFAGKTTILYKLGGEIKETMPTIGMNVESLEYRHKGFITSFTAWNVGGRDKFHPLWNHYYRSTVFLIFVIDCSDHERMETAKEKLEQLLEEDELQQVSLLVYANKQDLPNAMSVDKLIEKLDLQLLRHRRWHAQPTCAVTGEGVFEGLDWLISQKDAPADPVGAFEKSKACDTQFEQKGGPASVADTDSTADTDDGVQQFEVFSS